MSLGGAQRTVWCTIQLHATRNAEHSNTPRALHGHFLGFVQRSGCTLLLLVDAGWPLTLVVVQNLTATHVPTGTGCRSAPEHASEKREFKASGTTYALNHPLRLWPRPAGRRPERHPAAPRSTYLPTHHHHLRRNAPSSFLAHVCGQSHGRCRDTPDPTTRAPGPSRCPAFDRRR